MGLPKVTINVLNGNLGAIDPIEDGVAGLIITSDVAPSGLAFGASLKITSLAAAETAGITAVWEAANNTLGHTHIKEFFAAAGTGAELWIMCVVDTALMETICDVTTLTNSAKKLLTDAGGEIRLLGVTRKPSAAYEATTTNGFDDDAYNAVTKLNALAVAFAALYQPFVGIIDGRDYQGVAASLEDLRGLSFNNVAVLLANAGDTGDSASVGLLLGVLANLPVQRNIARVKNGALAITEAKLTDGTAVESAAGLDDIHDAGYVFIRTYVGKTGYYFSDDPVATALTDDYAYISRRRVINKVLQIAYSTYVNELGDEIAIDSDGKMNAAVVKALQGGVENAIDLDMTADGEISSCRCVIDPTQNVLSTNKVVVSLYITPVGYAKEIEVNIGFENPSLSS